MTDQKTARFRTVGDGSGVSQDETFTREEIQLALRNRGMPLEGLRYDITPTGMHYLLVHFDIPDVDATTWSLDIAGLVEKPLRLTIGDIRMRPTRTLTVTLECAGNGRALLTPRPISQPWLVEAIGTAEWTGTPLRPLLEEAGLREKAVDIVFTGIDRGIQGEEVQAYQRSLSVADALFDDVLLAYEMNSEPLQPQHGYPLRLIVPGWYGMASVKWLQRIEAIDEPFQGYQQIHSYRYTTTPDGLGEPVTLINVRALMVPPGIPDFLTRTRLVERGVHTLQGRAWAGRAQVERVEVSADRGTTWSAADVGKQPGPYAWRPWTFRWDATPGRYTLCVRATDASGSEQSIEQEWSYHGMGNNMAQCVDVIVE